MPPDHAICRSSYYGDCGSNLNVIDTDAHDSYGAPARLARTQCHCLTALNAVASSRFDPLDCASSTRAGGPSPDTSSRTVTVPSSALRLAATGYLGCGSRKQLAPASTAGGMSAVVDAGGAGGMGGAGFFDSSGDDGDATGAGGVVGAASATLLDSTATGFGCDCTGRSTAGLLVGFCRGVLAVGAGGALDSDGLIGSSGWGCATSCGASSTCRTCGSSGAC